MMNIMRLKLITCFVAVAVCATGTVYAQSGASDPCIERRAAFDIGSALTKLKVADVNTCMTTPIKVDNAGVEIRILHLPEARVLDVEVDIAFKDSLESNGGKSISADIFEQGKQEIAALVGQAKALDPQPSRYTAVATSAFRQLQAFVNGSTGTAEERAAAGDAIDDFFEHIAGLGIQVTVASSRIEAVVGLAGVAGVRHESPNDWLMWDIGGSSMQLLAVDHRGRAYFDGLTLGAIPFQIHVSRQIKGYPADRKQDNPNPMTADEIREALAEAKRLSAEQISEVQNYLELARAGSRRVEVIGIGGVHQYAVLGQMKTLAELEGGYTLAQLLTFLFEHRTGWNGDVEKPWGKTQVTNPALVAGVMGALGIIEVTVGSINLADGLLAGPELSAWGIDSSDIYN